MTRLDKEDLRLLTLRVEKYFSKDNRISDIYIRDDNVDKLYRKGNLQTIAVYFNLNNKQKTFNKTIDLDFENMFYNIDYIFEFIIKEILDSMVQKELPLLTYQYKIFGSSYQLDIQI